MRPHHQFSSLPMNRPLKSPSPDIKGKNAIVPTTSPQNFRKTYNQYTPQGKLKRQSYIECSTLPVKGTEKGGEMMIEKMFESTRKSNRYDQHQEYEGKAEEQTQAKGRYNFQLPQDLLQSFNNSNYVQQQHSNLLSTDKKPSPIATYYRNSPSPQHLLSLLNEKDTIISQLKQMINLMTENGKHLKNSQRTIREEEYERLRGEVKILTIENQKLAEIIDKLNDRNQRLQRSTQSERQSQVNRPKSHTEQFQRQQPTPHKQNTTHLHQTISSLEHQVHQLQEQLRSKQSHYQKQIDELINSHKSLAVECKMYENEKERFSRENERLINLLRLKEKEKETGFGGYAYVGNNSGKNRAREQQYSSKGNSSFSANSTNQQQQSTAQPSTAKEQLQQQKHPRLSLTLIKSQYEQNLHQYKQNIHHELTIFIETIRSTLQDLSDKLTVYEERILCLESVLKKDQESHLTSLEQGTQEQEIKKSAIYIQQAPSSERVETEGRSRQALSMILQESSRGHSRLEMEVSRLRKQLEFYKQALKVRGKQQSSLQQNSEREELQAQKGDNERKQTESNQDLVEQLESYRDRIKQLEQLVDQLREESEQRIRELQQKEGELQQKERQLVEMRMGIEDRERQLVQMRMVAQVNRPKSSQSLHDHNQSKIKQQSPLQLPLPIQQQQHTQQLLQTLQQQLLQTQTQLKLQTSQHQHLQHTLTHMQTSLEARQQQLLQQIENLQHVISQTEGAFISSKKEFQVERAAYEGKITECQGKIAELERELGKERKERDLERVKSGEVISCEIRQLKEGLERLESQRTQELQSKEKEVEGMSKSISQLQQKLVALQEESSRAQHNKTHLQQKIAKLQLQRSSLIQQVQQLGSQANQLKSLHSLLQHQHSTLQRQQSQLQSTLLSLTNKSQSLIKHCHQLTLQSYLQQLQSYMEHQQQRMTVLEQENGKCREQLSKALREVEGERNKLLLSNEQRIRLEQQLGEMGNRLELYKKELADRAAIYQKLVQEVSVLRQQSPLTTTATTLTATTTKQSTTTTNTTKQPTPTKTRIRSIIEHQKQKLSQLLTLIDQLNTQPL